MQAEEDVKQEMFDFCAHTLSRDMHPEATFSVPFIVVVPDSIVLPFTVKSLLSIMLFVFMSAHTEMSPLLHSMFVHTIGAISEASVRELVPVVKHSLLITGEHTELVAHMHEEDKLLMHPACAFMLFVHTLLDRPQIADVFAFMQHVLFAISVSIVSSLLSIHCMQASDVSDVPVLFVKLLSILCVLYFF